MKLYVGMKLQRLGDGSQWTVKEICPNGSFVLVCSDGWGRHPRAFFAGQELSFRE